MRPFIMVLAAVVMTGCSALHEKPSGAGRAPADGALLSELLAQTVRAAEAGASEQQAALADAQHAFQTQASDVNRLRYAALLAALPPPSRDEARAVTLLQPLALRRESALGQFAVLLSAQIAERTQDLRERERAQRVTERREETLKQHNEQLRKENETLRQQADALKQQQETLRAQIEALRSIERGILRREDRLRLK